ncbi:DMT family transporter [Blastochloris viridis]|uniref:Inner membrane protein ytfF n=1 Tax=Blastochloris viridis TaxID=1079 RepID=A0A0H5B7P7_BLAVI|nr:DMT family transporter [Blastochloris viridis]ALK08516.1 Inner membrane protein YtfF [Blastochloris viridis]BAR98197.1 integral membrane protein [Blastochloris viridis]CUU41178.1 Inner membrane protein ytfF [Blastochloris viridis]
MVVGLAAGLGAGVLWGLTFVAPAMVAPWTPTQLTLLRFGVFGLSACVVLAASPRASWWPVLRRHWARLLVLGLTGYTLYYLLLAEAVRLAGPALPTLVIGTLPVVMAVAGGLRRPGFRVGRFVLPAALILAALALRLQSAEPGAGGGALAGLGLALLALASWTFYGLANAEFLAARPAIGASAWTALTGVATLATLPPLALLRPADEVFGWPAGADLAVLMGWSAALAWLASWLATWLWNVASGRVPGEMLGYLIVSETVFGLLYAMAAAWHLPTGVELLGIALLIGGVVLGLAAAPKPANG